MLEGPTDFYMRMQDGCHVYMISFMALNGSCFMVTWTIFKNHLLEVGLIQNRETMALRTFTTIDLFYYTMREDQHEQKFIERAFDWGLDHIWLHITLENLWPHYMILKVSWDGLSTLSFWTFTIPWSRLLDCVWSGSRENASESPPALTCAGHQWTVPTNIAYTQWLSLAKRTLKVVRAGRNGSMVTCTRLRKWGMNA